VAKKQETDDEKPTLRVFGRTRPKPDPNGDPVLQWNEDKAHGDIGSKRYTARRPLPPPWKKPPFQLDLNDIYAGSKFQTNYPQHTGTTVFQLSGDTGNTPNGDNRAQLNVVDGMESQFANEGIYNPAFFYSCGDCVYYSGEEKQYYAQFYEPYEHYPGPVLAIPGNHDGENEVGETSLHGFIYNFCAPEPVHRSEARTIPRWAMNQPYVYWTLIAPKVRVIGVYTNVEPGGSIDEDQFRWLVGELEAAKKDYDNRAVILTMHHPIYSLDDHHSGSPHVQQPVMDAIKEAGCYPDMIIGAHVHNMQRFTVEAEKGIVPYLVAGAGGYNNLHKMQKAVKATQTPITLKDTAYNVNVTLNSYVDDDHGFFRFEVSKDTIVGEYFTTPRPQDPYSRGPRLFERFTYNRKQRKYVPNAIVQRYPGTGYPK